MLIRAFKSFSEISLHFSIILVHILVSILNRFLTISLELLREPKTVIFFLFTGRHKAHIPKAALIACLFYLIICCLIFSETLSFLKPLLKPYFSKKSLFLTILIFALHSTTFTLINPNGYYFREQKWLFICGDIKLNPGHKTEHLRLCHWNLNSLVAHSFSRISLLHSYMVQHDLHIAAISESALSKNVSDSDIQIPGYSTKRYDLDDSDSHGGVVIYHKTNLAVVNRTDLPTPQYTLILEITINKKKTFLIHSYRKSGQTSNQAKNFTNKFDDLLGKIGELKSYVTIVTGDFNAHHRDWYNQGKTDTIGTTFKEIFDSYCLKQIVNQPTYYNPQNPNSKTLVDLFAINQPNLVVANEVHPPLHPTCHHYINFVKLNLKNPVPSPFKRFVWHYNRANERAIYEACKSFDWRLSLNTLNAEEAVNFFDETLTNICKNYIPHEDKLFKPKDPPWITNASRNLYSTYKRKFKRFVNRGCPPEQKECLDSLKIEYSESVSLEKDKYLKKLGDQVSNPQTGQKKYWSALKKLINKSSATIIPPILFNGSFITNFKEKCCIFNDYFKNQCTLLPTTSVLPPLVITTDLRLSSVSFTEKDIVSHIRKLNINKANGHDNISARILKICDDIGCP